MKVGRSGVERGASDLHIKAGDVFRARISGKLKAIAQSAAGIRLPAVYQVSEFVDAGGLMSYGLNMLRQHRRTGNN